MSADIVLDVEQKTIGEVMVAAGAPLSLCGDKGRYKILTVGGRKVCARVFRGVAEDYAAISGPVVRWVRNALDTTDLRGFMRENYR